MPDAGYLTIGKVVKRLQSLYPDLTISKVRYLEDEGLLNPSRTPGGYRLYSQRDIKRLETILYLQKNRFLPLSVIKDELDRQDAGEPPASATESAVEASLVGPVDEELVEKFHPIDRMPEVAGVPVSFVRQLSEAGVITLKRSPHGRDLVDGHDIGLIRTCDELRHYGIGPKNLRQYVNSANRESAMFEQALVVYAKKGGGVETEVTDETRERFEQAFSRMLALTDVVRTELIRRLVHQSFKDMEG
ncbi:MerR family transcriptional regulator [Olsenella sp. AM30-3LB]|jgi:DNA-binding transcriptional MerR regulator|uniref:transcriptional regulator FtsR n=1 Tax=Atopobiaceae TaxID=1643824 RepID=UPI000E44769C|nr:MULTISPECIES: MerR family transcriptional regulator [unclassified Olsenella]RGJ47350.1 MerR family transcriptional regulator [Olsenella sp. TM06-36]RGS53036.1 MerR family transcriptional regulator [Olsenella sp. AF21-51]RHD75431.1 MerR family transcriptional regulator [Olsenella sp. AM30-3LB]